MILYAFVFRRSHVLSEHIVDYMFIGASFCISSHRNVHRYVYICMGEFVFVVYVHVSPCDDFMKLNLYMGGLMPVACICVYIRIRHLA